MLFTVTFPANYHTNLFRCVGMLPAGLFNRPREKGLLRLGHHHGRPGLCRFVCLLLALAGPPGSVSAADFFTDTAANPVLMRDGHVVSVGGERLDTAGTRDGQNFSINYRQLGAGGNLWNNERNQVLAGVQYERRDFGRTIALPEGFAIPQQLDSISVSLHYKHITTGDWSLSQSVQYTQSETDQASLTVQDSVDLLGLAARVSEPGVAWMFGYAYLEKNSIDPLVLPVVEYVYAKASDRWSFIVGFPILGFAYTPHPDWLVGGGGGGIAVSYKVTQTNIVRLAYTQNSWAYGLTGPNVKSVDYTAQRVSLDWTALYLVNHRRGFVVNALLGWEFDRELGADQKLSVGDTAVVGIEASFIF